LIRLRLIGHSVPVVACPAAAIGDRFLRSIQTVCSRPFQLAYGARGSCPLADDTQHYGSNIVLLPRVGPKLLIAPGMLLAAGALAWLTRIGDN